MDSAEESRRGSVVPTPNRASLMQLAVLFLRLGLTALVAINDIRQALREETP